MFDNTVGLHLNNNGNHRTVVKKNFLSGGVQRKGIVSDEGLRETVITENTLTGHADASMLLTSNPSAPLVEEVTVKGNMLEKDAKLAIYNAQKITVTNNQLLQSIGDALVIGDNVGEAEITGNSIEESVGNGIVADQSGTEAPKSLLIKGNEVFDVEQTGIILQQVVDSSVLGNKVHRPGGGKGFS